MLPPHQFGLKMIKSASKRAIQPHQRTINEVEERRQKECELGLGEGRKGNQSFGASISLSCAGLEDQSSLVEVATSCCMLL